MAQTTHLARLGPFPSSWACVGLCWLLGPSWAFVAVVHAKEGCSGCSDEDGSPTGKFWPTRTRTRQYPHPYLRVQDSRQYGCGFPPLPWVCKLIAGLCYRSVFTSADSPYHVVPVHH